MDELFSAETLRIATEEASYFLTNFHPDRPIHVTTIDRAGRIATRTFEPAEQQAIFDYVKSKQNHCNVYFTVNALLVSVKHRKAKKADVAAAIALHVDIDDLSGRERLRAYRIKPSVIVFSGGGFQAYWFLKEPLLDLGLAERLNDALARDLGGDHCGNADRIMRVPGTVNLPNAKKAAGGRVPVMAKLVEADWGLTYAVEDFEAPGGAVAALNEELADIGPVAVDMLPFSVLPFTRRLIEDGDDIIRPIGTELARYPSRSEVVWHVACDLGRAGCTPQQIAGVLLNPEHRISASVLEKPNPKTYALKQARAALTVVGEGWPDVTKDGNPRASMLNAIVALMRLDLIFGYDLFRYRKIINGEALEEHQGDISDEACAFLRGAILDKFGFDPRAVHVRDAVTLLCLQRAFHPVRDMLDALAWDGVSRLDGWMTTYLGAEDTPLNRAIGSITLIAAVRRVREPGVKFDQIVVWEGKQGSGKSTAVSILAGPGFHSDTEILTLDTKAQIEALEGVWLQELGEIEGLNRGEVNRIKAFASRTTDRARMAYAYHSVARRRQAIFIGTTNEDKYLRDQTGNRRFWPVKTGAIELDALRRDRDQLLAEAVHREAQGESIVLSPDLWDAAAQEQAARMEDDPWIEQIEGAKPEVIGDRLRHVSQELLGVVLGVSVERQNQAHTKRLAALMRKLGWEAVRVRVGNRVVRGYERAKPDDYDPGRRKQEF